MSEANATMRHEDTEPLLNQEQEAGHTSFYSSPSTIVNIGGEPDRDLPKDRLQHHREMVRDRFSFNWWIEWIIILVVFSVTGSSTMLVVRPLMKLLGFTGSFWGGPWSFRIVCIVLTLPLYSCMLLLISSLVCRRLYFEDILIRMWSRLLPKFILNRCSATREQTP